MAALWPSSNKAAYIRAIADAIADMFKQISA